MYLRSLIGFNIFFEQKNNAQLNAKPATNIL